MPNEKQTLSVSEISTMIEEEGLGWTAGDTPLSALPPSEQEMYLGLIVTEEELQQMAEAVKREAAQEMRAMAAAPAVGAPKAWDWRNVGGRDYVTPVKNQGPCGSCVSFGTCAAMEANMRIKANDHTLDFDLSEAFLQFCGGGSCGGWGLTSGMAFAKSTGVTDENCFPYQPKNMACNLRCNNWQSRLQKLLGYQSHSSMDARKAALVKGPVVAGMAVYSDFYAYTSGVYRKVKNSELRGYHCVCVVGYDDDQQCWIVKNSWGDKWGDNGYIYIGYGQADLLIDSSWAFYSVDPDIEPVQGSGYAEHVLVDKHFSGLVRLWAYVDGKWRYRNISDAELAGIAQVLFAATRVRVYWYKNEIRTIQPWKSL